MMLLTGPAVAAGVHNVDTSLNLSVNKHQVKAGRSVKFTLVMHADQYEKKCTVHQPTLWYRNGNFVTTLRTDTSGRVIFIRAINHTATFFVKFSGNRVGHHPNRLD